MHIYANAVIIVLGLLLGFGATGYLYYSRTGSWNCLPAYFLLSFAIGVFSGRMLHWYFTSFSYSGGFFQALVNYSVGSIAMCGVILGPWIAARLIEANGLCKNRARLLDCTAPGVVLVMFAVRFGAAFNDSCRGKTVSFHLPPISVRVTGAAGNVSYKFGTFAIEAILLLLALAAVVLLYFRFGKTKMVKPVSASGNIWRMMLVLTSCIEFVMDSTRTDSLLMHFRFIHSLNAYSAFISLTEVFSLIMLIYVFVYYLRRLIAADGFSIKHIVFIVLFLVCAFGMGYLGEYRIQRHGETFRGYLFMLVSLIAVGAMLFLLYFAATACGRNAGRKAKKSRFGQFVGLYLNY